MKKKQSQSGFAHLIIIVLLAIALIGTLGFVYYQNFIQKKDPVVVTDDATVKTDVNDGYLVLDDWNVKFKLPDLDNGTEIESQKFESAGIYGDYYTLSTNRFYGLIQNNSTCSSSQYRIYRSASLIDQVPSAPGLIASINGFNFYFIGPQSSCTDENSEDRLIETEYSRLIPIIAKSISEK